MNLCPTDLRTYDAACFATSQPTSYEYTYNLHLIVSLTSTVKLPSTNTDQGTGTLRLVIRVAL